MEQLNTEILLNSDGNFYKRTVVTTPIMDQETAIQRVKAKPIFYACPIPYASRNSYVNCSHVLQYVDGISRTHSICSEIKRFPFNGASLYKYNSDDTNYMLYMSDRRTGQAMFPTSHPNGHEVINGRELDLAYKPGDYQSLYIMVTYEYRDGLVKTSAPCLFLYDAENSSSYHPNLPNIYSGKGEICAGNDFPRSSDSGKNTLELHYEQLDNLFHSLSNNDLRNISAEQYGLMFDANGNYLQPDVATIPDNKRFYEPVTRETVLEFTNFLNKLDDE